MAPMTSTVHTDIVAANAAFYRAFRNRDYAAMEALWSPEPTVSCYHPGWPGIVGRDEVMASWYNILVLGEAPAVVERDVSVIRNGPTAMVMCTEDLGEARLIATNTFVLENGRWMMTHHQAAHLPG